MATKHVSARLLFSWLYEDISREKAEELLMLPSNHEGSFLIRKSQMIKGIGDSPLKSDKKKTPNQTKPNQGRKLIRTRNARRNVEFLSLSHILFPTLKAACNKQQ